MEKILSISVAAYNLEKYIEQNIKSFINSKYRDEIEVLIIDDESTDQTANIVKRYEKAYPNTIRLIKQKNAGPGSTVNNGIKNAKGKYFKMVDGDDWVETSQLDEMIEKLRNVKTDLIITNYEKYSEKEKKIIEVINADLPKNIDLQFNEVCSKLFLPMHQITIKTSILQNNKVKLDNGFYTDTEYALYPLPYVKTIMYLDLNIYVYRIARAGQSVSIKSLQKNIEMHNEVLNNLITFYEKNKPNLDITVLEHIAKRIARVAWNETATMLTFKNNKDMKKDIKEFILKLKNKSYDIYKMYIKRNSAKLIVYSGYSLVWLMSKIKQFKVRNDY